MDQGSTENQSQWSQYPVSNILDKAYVEEFKVTQQLPPDATPTPFRSLNAMCRDDGGGIGIGRGWNVTIGANTGNGKSLMALNFAAAALEAGECVGFVSLEMSKEQLSTRLYAVSSGIRVIELEKGPSYNPLALEQAYEGMKERFGYTPHLLVNNDPLSSVHEVQDMLDTMRTNGCRWFVVDYIQLVGSGSMDSILRQVTEASSLLRRYAKKHKVTIVGLSQFNRTTSMERKLRPLPQGLMGGSPLENDSDLVLLLDHSRRETHGHTARTYLMNAKNRHGPVGDLPIEWDFSTLRAREAFPDEEQLWPK